MLAKQPLYWTYLALSSERIDQRAQEIADEIAEARRKGADSGGDEDEAEK